MRHLDVHDDDVGREQGCAIDRLARVANALRFKLVNAQQIAKEFQIEFIVLDNEHPFCHASFPTDFPGNDL